MLHNYCVGIALNTGVPFNKENIKIQVLKMSLYQRV